MKKLFLGVSLVAVFLLGGLTVNFYSSIVSAEDVSINKHYNNSKHKNHIEGTDHECAMNLKHGFGGGHGIIMGDGIEHKAFNIDNGVIIEAISSDPEVVSTIQEYMKNDNKEHLQHLSGTINMERIVENIDNGVRVTLTSDDDDTVILLQQKHTADEDGSYNCERHNDE